MRLHCVDNPAVKAVLDSYPQDMLPRLEDLRADIISVAKAMPGVGGIEETLKWGQPAYRPLRPRTGTTVRIGPYDSEGRYALFVPCQTSLIDDFKRLYRDRFRYGGKRAIVFEAGEIPDVVPLRHCIALALTYHARVVTPASMSAAKRSSRIGRTLAVTSP
jgi:hypothetical protein